MVSQASIAEARAHLSELVNKVAYGRERIVLTSRGRPKAALVSLDDVASLEDLSVKVQRVDSLPALEEADRFVEQLSQERHGVPMSPSIEDLYAIRDGEE
ncbi:MAG: type II toxin-antitoxin system Phd/YefM family antitoxin [Chloroflexota bacterium]